MRLENLLPKEVIKKIENIRNHPNRHNHDFAGLVRCCMVKDGVIAREILEAHLQYSQGRCTTVEGECSCGGSHNLKDKTLFQSVGGFVFHTGDWVYTSDIKPGNDHEHENGGAWAHIKKIENGHAEVIYGIESDQATVRLSSLTFGAVGDPATAIRGW